VNFVNDFFHSKSTVNTLSSKGVGKLQLARGHVAEWHFDEELVRNLNAQILITLSYSLTLIKLFSAENGLDSPLCFSAGR